MVPMIYGRNLLVVTVPVFYIVEEQTGNETDLDSNTCIEQKI
jgi:hypothetical protein